MLTNQKRRNRVLTLVALTLLVGVPELAMAQQSGLFPNATIRRARPSCAQEDPIYKLYRHQYYGFHPTCWRRFPDGWGCPSPEAPDREKSYQEIPKKPPTPIDMPELDEGAAPGRDEGMERPEDRAPRSPFEQLPPVPENTKPLFPPDDADQGGPAGAPPANPPQANRMPRGRELGASDAEVMTSDEFRPRTRDERDDRPILAMSDESATDPVGPADHESAGPTGDVLPAVDVPPIPAKPNRPPARRGVLSGLFSGNGWGWLRR
jgi:hypothetical protein